MSDHDIYKPLSLTWLFTISVSDYFEHVLSNNDPSSATDGHEKQKEKDAMKVSGKQIRISITYEGSFSGYTIKPKNPVKWWTHNNLTCGI